MCFDHLIFELFQLIYFLGSSSTPRGNSTKGADGKKPVECEICHKTLADPSSLYRHRKMHAGIKPHQCPHCDKSFGQRLDIFPSFFVIFHHFPSFSVIEFKTLEDPSHLYLHRKMHQGIKPHHYPHCDKEFWSKVKVRYISVKWHPNLHKTYGRWSIIFATLTFFHLTNFLEKKISLLKSYQIFRGTFIKFFFSFFISNFVFRRQPPEFFSSIKICLMKSSQNNK